LSPQSFPSSGSTADEFTILYSQTKLFVCGLQIKSSQQLAGGCLTKLASSSINCAHFGPQPEEQNSVASQLFD